MSRKLVDGAIFLVCFLIASLALIGLHAAPGVTKTTMGRVPMLGYLINEYRSVKAKAGVVLAINYNKPSLEGLVSDVRREGRPDRDGALRLASFYREISSYFNDNSEAHALYAYALFWSGDHEGALLEYRNAIDIHNAFFWSLYNYGVVSLRLGKYNDAVYFFKRALSADPRAASLVVSRSRLYSDVWRGIPGVQAIVLRNIEMSRRDILEVLSLFEKAREDLSVRGFLKERVDRLEPHIF